MRIARFHPNNRVAIAICTAIGLGNPLLRVLIHSLGSAVGVATGMLATVVISALVYWVLEWSIKH